MKSLLLCVFISALSNLGVLKITAEGNADPFLVPANDNLGINDELALDDSLGAPISEDELSASEDLVEEEWDPDQDPIELAGLFEGDIDNFAQDDVADDENDIYGANRNAIRDTRRKWPNAQIPYVISNQFNSNERLVIAKAIKTYHDKTCIRFRARSSGDTAFIHILKGSGCSSHVGRTGYEQAVSLANGCLYTGIVIHEFMHAAGFWHEQSRADRDDHVRINWNNILTGMEFNFQKYSLTTINHLNAAYDTCSVMHYGAYAFSKNGQPTISQIRQGQCNLGQRDGFSDTDIRKLNTLYQCKGYPQTGNTTPKPTTTTTTTTGTGDCEDQNEFCSDWASEGECSNNPDYMLESCPKSCGTCEGSECVDKNQYCEDWASKGECQRNPDYMNLDCPKACNTCDGGSSCADLDSSCDVWATFGHCSSVYQPYMEENCKKACNFC